MNKNTFSTMHCYESCNSLSERRISDRTTETLQRMLRTAHGPFASEELCLPIVNYGGNAMEDPGKPILRS
jgi:hypothetical protein